MDITTPRVAAATTALVLTASLAGLAVGFSSLPADTARSQIASVVTDSADPAVAAPTPRSIADSCAAVAMATGARVPDRIDERYRRCLDARSATADAAIGASRPDAPPLRTQGRTADALDRSR